MPAHFGLSKGLSVTLGPNKYLSPHLQHTPPVQGDKIIQNLVILQALFDLYNIFVLGDLAEVKFAQSEFSVHRVNYMYV